MGTKSARQSYVEREYASSRRSTSACRSSGARRRAGATRAGSCRGSCCSARAQKDAFEEIAAGRENGASETRITQVLAQFPELKTMLPSSRTPEGDPLRCDVCGASEAVDFSTPPGDSVCPVCGCHSWATPNPRNVNSIREFVRELSDLCPRTESIDTIGSFLVSGLMSSLAAHGASLWIAKKRKGRRRQASLELAVSTGQQEPPIFAQEVSAANDEVVRNTQVTGADVLLIGVPVRRDERIVAVITIVRRSGSPAAIQRGYLRFVNQMAEVFATSPLLD